MLGHASLRTTLIYAKVIKTKVSRVMQKLKNKFKVKENEEKSSVINYTVYFPEP